MNTLSSTFLASVTLLVACADPDKSFDDFVGRAEIIKDNASGGGGGGGGGGGDVCVVPAAGARDGNYLFALSASLSPSTPVIFLAKLKTTAQSNGIEFSMNVQPLKDADRKTPTGVASDVGPFPVGADGKFDAQLPSLTVPFDANPILHNEFDATSKLTGTLCADPADFICGSVSGSVTRPTPLPLDGSTFGMVKITDPNSYPEALIDCARKNAPPP